MALVPSFTLVLALVVGRASGVWEERLAAIQLATPDTILVVNGAGVDHPGPFDHWVSWHADLFPKWLALRRQTGQEAPSSFWTARYRGHTRKAGRRPRGRSVPEPIPLKYVDGTFGGSSGLIAVLVALDKLQVTHVILAGIPMSPERGHYDNSMSWSEGMRHRKAWTTLLPRLLPRVRSMSGWTAELLGTPDRAWLETIHVV